MGTWKAYLDHQAHLDLRFLHLARTEPDGSRNLVKPLQLTPVPKWGVAPELQGVLGDMTGETDDFLRAIMTVAWDAGIRPTGFQDHTNELTAVRYHLEDMRSLAKIPKGKM